MHAPKMNLQHKGAALNYVGRRGGINLPTEGRGGSKNLQNLALLVSGIPPYKLNSEWQVIKGKSRSLFKSKIDWSFTASF